MVREESTKCPKAKVSGKKGFYIRCPYPDCPFFCRQYHLYHAHLQENHQCQHCGLYCERLRSHVCKKAQTGGSRPDNVVVDTSVFSEHMRAHRGAVRSYIHYYEPTLTDIPEAFVNVNEASVRLISQLLQIFGNLKLIIKVVIVFARRVFDSDGSVDEIEQIAYFTNTTPISIYSVDDIEAAVARISDEINEKKNDFVSKGSGYRVKKVISLEIKALELVPFGSSVEGSSYLPMPFKITKKGYWNFRTNNCFKFSVTAGLHWKSLENSCSYDKLRWPKTYEQFFHLYNWDGVEGDGVKLFTDVEKFELNNKVSINTYSHHENNIIFARESPYKFEKVVNLFLINSPDGQSGHYVLIRDLSKFLRHRNTKRKHVCPYCKKTFIKERTQMAHSLRCRETEIEDDLFEEEYPEEEERLQFNKPHMLLPYAFYICYDIEAFSAKSEKTHIGMSTEVISEYHPATFSLVVVAHGHEKSKIIAIDYYDGPDCMNMFFRKIFRYAFSTALFIRTVNNRARPTKEELQRHNEATHCYFCKKEFLTESMFDPFTMTKQELLARRKCFHHSHSTGRYCYALCNSCNLRLRWQNEIVILGHNASGYDHKLIIQALSSEFVDKKSIQVIAKSTERVIQITLTAKNKYLPALFNPAYCGHTPTYSKYANSVRVRLIDSLNFMPGKLSSLFDALVKENNPILRLVKDAFPTIIGDYTREASDEDIAYLNMKLNFPYDFLDSPAKLQDSVAIPEKKWFDNSLTGTKMSDEDYKTVLEICGRFNIRNFRQYTRMYNISDSVLLTCIVENYRTKSIKHFELDPLYTCSLSAFAWECFLYTTRSVVNYIKDPGMLEMVSGPSIRGGCCLSTMKFIRANNERMEDYDPEKPRTHIISCDFNSLYPHALLGRFPVDEYEWVSPSELEKIDWKSDEVGQDGYGYILSVKLHYPHEIHLLTRDLPLCPMKRIVSYNELSPQQQANVDRLGSIGKSYLSTPKMILDNLDKDHYNVYFDTLRTYLKLGMQLVKIYKGFRFREAEIFRPFIERNLLLRSLALSPTESFIIKVTSNSVYGRTLFNKWRLMEVIFAGSRECLLKATKSSRFKDIIILNESLSMLFFAPKKIRHDTIISSGFVCLDRSKKIYYETYFTKVLPAFNFRARLAYKDTGKKFPQSQNFSKSTKWKFF